MVTGPRALELYRIAQEAIGNALKHGRCHRIEVGLTLRGSAFELSIRDDGIGVNLAATEGGPGIGLQTMRYRAARAGGTLEVRSHPGHGTTVHVRVPLLTEESARAAVHSVA
jgi:signal transduction histidine kinase